MPSGLKPIIFPTTHTLDADWKKFIQAHNITDPEAYLQAMTMPVNALGSLQIGIGTACNFDCPMCFNHFDKIYNYYSLKELETENVIELIRRNAPLHNLCFGVSGEPFLHPKIFEILEGTRPFVESFTFSTNAALLTQEKVERLAGFPVQTIFVSVDGSDKETYERFRKNGQFEKLRHNLSGLAETFGAKVIVAATVFKQNMESVVNIPRLCHETGVKNLFIFRMFEHPRAHEKGVEKLDRHEMLDFMVRVLEQCDQYGIITNWDTRAVDRPMAREINRLTRNRHAQDMDIFNRACSIPFDGLLIDAEGNYNFCCALEPIPADALKTSVADLYNSAAVKKMRVMNILGHFPSMCRKYCHKLSTSENDTSLVTLRKLAREKFIWCPASWQPLDFLPDFEKIAIMPFGGLSKDLIHKGTLSLNKIAAIADQNHLKLKAEAAPLPICGYEGLFPMNFDAILITSGAFGEEIFNWLIAHLPACLEKNIYRIAANDLIVRQFIGHALLPKEGS